MQIMKELLLHDRPVISHSSDNDYFERDRDLNDTGLGTASNMKLPKSRLLHPEILRTCSQIYRKARPLF
jgi:hypothetical protein